MESVFRILDHGTIAIRIGGLSESQALLLRRIAGPPGGPDREPSSAPAPLSGGAVTAGRNEVIVSGSPENIRHVLTAAEQENSVPVDRLKRIGAYLDNYQRTDYTITCKDRILDLGSRTHIMGILNVTPDSFSDGGLFLDAERAVEHAREMADHGADVLDIGGESTRPGSKPLTADEEMRRIIPLIRRLAGELPVPISVDTYKSAVAKKALDVGASMINDISGLRFSPDMARVAADYGAAVVIMHIKGTPQDMQQNPKYSDVVTEVAAYLEEGIEIALKAGVREEQILIDPGIGFGKTVEHNLELLNRLGEFRMLGKPILIGTSRKSFIGTALGIADPGLRAEGTAATLALGIERGARMLRVHDVAPMVRVARMTDAIVNIKANGTETP